MKRSITYTTRAGTFRSVANLLVLLLSKNAMLASWFLSWHYRDFEEYNLEQHLSNKVCTWSKKKAVKVWWLTYHLHIYRFFDRLPLCCHSAMFNLILLRLGDWHGWICIFLLFSSDQIEFVKFLFETCYCL
jgi:hypothetical protein